ATSAIRRLRSSPPPVKGRPPPSRCMPTWSTTTSNRLSGPAHGLVSRPGRRAAGLVYAGPDRGRRTLRGPAMADPLVETKLHLPRVRPDVVARARLDDRLRQADQARLTLVSAPAGFGKTTLLAGWFAAAAAAGRHVAWVSLDEADSQGASFWAY